MEERIHYKYYLVRFVDHGNSMEVLSRANTADQLRCHIQNTIKLRKIPVHELLVVMPIEGITLQLDPQIDITFPADIM
jgi:hypothetical protein